MGVVYVPGDVQESCSLVFVDDLYLRMLVELCAEEVGRT